MLLTYINMVIVQSYFSLQEGNVSKSKQSRWFVGPLVPAFESWWHVIQKISGIWDVPISGGTTKSNSANLVIGSHQQVMTKKNLLDQLR